MKHIYFLLLFGFATCNAIEFPVDPEIVHDTALKMRKLRYDAYHNRCPYSGEALDILDILANNNSSFQAIPLAVDHVLKYQGFLKQDGLFDEDKLIAWKFIINLRKEHGVT